MLAFALPCEPLSRQGRGPGALAAEAGPFNCERNRDSKGEWPRCGPCCQLHPWSSLVGKKEHLLALELEFDWSPGSALVGKSFLLWNSVSISAAALILILITITVAAAAITTTTAIFLTYA